jgi:hypothetical protein
VNFNLKATYYTKVVGDQLLQAHDRSTTVRSCWDSSSAGLEQERLSDNAQEICPTRSCQGRTWSNLEVDSVHEDRYLRAAKLRSCLSDGAKCNEYE